MKILLITTEYPPFKGGVAHYYSHLIKYWPDNNLTVLSNNNNELINPEAKILKWRKAFRELLRRARRKEFDYLLVGQILPLGLVAWPLSFLFNFRYAVFLHGLDFSLAVKGGRKRWLSRLILRRADSIISANSFVGRQAEEFIGHSKKKTIVINPGLGSVPTAETTTIDYLKKQYSLTDKKIVLSLGRLVRRKGFDYSLQAFKKINNEDWIYVIVGKGPDEEYLKQTARELFGDNYSQKIIFAGEASEAEKSAWMELFDIFLMPSRNIAGDYEGFGIVYLEANAYGKPVIAGRSGGVGDAVIDGLNGLLVDPDDIGDISRALTVLLSDGELRQRLGTAGKMRAITDFSWQHQAEKLYKFLK